MSEANFNKYRFGTTETNFHSLYYLALFTSFFLLTIIIGTLSHEMGHVIVAKALKYDVKVDYHSMEWYKTNHKNFVKPKMHDIYVTVGGILMTCLTSLVAFYFLLKKKEIDNLFWILLFCSLFISRQIINLIVSSIVKILFKKDSYFSGDEYELSILLGFHEGFFSLITAILAGVICFYVIFYILPKKFRIVFLISSFIGGVGGYYLWFFKIGKYILPPIN